MTVRADKGIGFAVIAALVVGAFLTWGAAAPATAEAACKGAHAASNSVPKQRARKAVRCLINKKRSNMRLHRQLSDAAQAHSGYMRKKDCFSHQCPGEAPLGTRIGRTGYLSGASSYSYGEVIARAPRAARPIDMVRLWMDSPPHREILMNRAYKHIGVGLAIKGSSVYYTAVVARRSG